MNLKEFQELSKRTMPFGGEPANQVEFENMLGNYSMGLVGEYLEYVSADWKGDQEDADKEMGDTLHYCVGLLSCLGEQVDMQKVDNISYDVDTFQKCLSDILEIPKKHIYHRHDLNKVDLIKAVYIVIKNFYLGSSEKWLSEVMQMNIDKLKTRYPGSFTAEDSIKRVDVNA